MLSWRGMTLNLVQGTKLDNWVQHWTWKVQSNNITISISVKLVVHKMAQRWQGNRVMGHIIEFNGMKKWPNIKHDYFKY